VTLAVWTAAFNLFHFLQYGRFIELHGIYIAACSQDLVCVEWVFAYVIQYTDYNVPMLQC